ncbi:MAG: transporter ATP-binding protein [Clostridia bacterium]|jgi:iron(III) transport system ATP-binding protein|uniref:ABC transporter ATP-binding protein n=1 Tax=Petroclostridium xylanilyticum TaxID=1792311 RepID=UPI000B98BD5E|nr:ABC transporter ATP-binding protein [Petroclostridium xylanilyticum]MBZ4647167.1 transporter ATP-binding protein [Clostridia bacterium]
MKLVIENLNFSYHTKAERIFNGFSLSVEEGEILAVLGSSGCGKSTLLRIISGLEENAQGIIRVGNTIFQDQSVFVPVEKRNIGFMFQDYALFPFMTVEQNIRFGMKKPCSEQLHQLLELTHLEGLEKRYPHELSGGQQQRTALARTLASKPALLLMDEPFSNLDTNLVDELRKDLKQIIKSQKITTVLVTHNRDDADYFADKVIQLSS